MRFLCIFALFHFSSRCLYNWPNHWIVGKKCQLSLSKFPCNGTLVDFNHSNESLNAPEEMTVHRTAFKYKGHSLTPWKESITGCIYLSRELQEM